jgi:hypothetical protein
MSPSATIAWANRYSSSNTVLFAWRAKDGVTRVRSSSASSRSCSGRGWSARPSPLPYRVASAFAAAMARAMRRFSDRSAACSASEARACCGGLGRRGFTRSRFRPIRSCDFARRRAPRYRRWVGLSFDSAIDLFLDHVKIERGLARNSVEAYARDLAKFSRFIDGEGIDDAGEVESRSRGPSWRRARKRATSSPCASSFATCAPSATSSTIRPRTSSCPSSGGHFPSP